MSPCDVMIDPINVGHSDLYFIVQLTNFASLCVQVILVLLEKCDSGELRCPTTALIG